MKTRTNSKISVMAAVSLMVLLLPPSVIPQNSITSRAEDVDSCASADKAIDLFLVNEVALGYRWFISDIRALNVAADISGYLHSRREDASMSYIQGNTFSRGFAISARFQMQWFMNTAVDQVRLYAAAGPIVAFSRQYLRIERIDNYDNPPTVDVSEEVDQSFDAGILLTAGVEFQVTRIFTVLSQFDLSGTYGTASGRGYSTYRRWQLTLSRLRLGLGIHV